MISYLLVVEQHRTQIVIHADRKSGSAGMPRPISYAVFCLKKKKMPSVTVVLFNQARHPQGLYSAVDIGMTFLSLPSFILKFLPPSLAKPGTSAGADGGRLNV